MNFLAHLYLSGGDTDLMVGNFIGDFVKGRNLDDRYPERIAKGIELHRAIDEFTDSNAIVQESKKRLRAKYRHYSGVIVDVFYDHFLARNWNTYHEQPLEDFAHFTYELIRNTPVQLPDRVYAMLPYMERGNWLVNYAQIEGIHRALTGMSRRTPYESKMEEASTDLSRNYELFKKEFDDFFPLLQTHCKEFVKGIK